MGRKGVEKPVMDIYNCNTRLHLLVRPDDMIVIDISPTETIDLRGDELVKAVMMVRRQHNLELDDENRN